MKTFSKNKGTWAAVLIFIAVIFLYKTFFAGDTSLEDQGAAASAVGDDILAMQARLDSVNLDLSLFSSPDYQALVDFSPILPTEPVGRAHPFDPLGK
jgi:hypothetical protein